MATSVCKSQCLYNTSMMEISDSISDSIQYSLYVLYHKVFEAIATANNEDVNDWIPVGVEKSDAAMVQMMQTSLRNRAKVLARGD
jgi:hypothetical protein